MKAFRFALLIFSMTLTSASVLKAADAPAGTANPTNPSQGSGTNNTSTGTTTKYDDAKPANTENQSPAATPGNSQPASQTQSAPGMSGAGKTPMNNNTMNGNTMKTGKRMGSQAGRDSAMGNGMTMHGNAKMGTMHGRKMGARKSSRMAMTTHRIKGHPMRKMGKHHRRMNAMAMDGRRGMRAMNSHGGKRHAMRRGRMPAAYAADFGPFDMVFGVLGAFDVFGMCDYE